MKIAVYTIALNEEANAEQFMQVTQGADIVAVGDTGSKDKTTQIIKDHGGHVANICIAPWRFDVPRNTMLSLLPADVDLCIALDLDETLPANWRDLLENNWDKDRHDRFRFRYVHNINADGSRGITGMKDFAHSRHNYIWRHAVHEQVYYVGKGQERVLTLTDFVVEHRQDLSKSRASYLELLEVECQSPTATPRHIFWLGREYIHREEWEKALFWFEKFLTMDDVWYVERAHAKRYIAKAFSHTGEEAKAATMHYASVEEAPKEREVWMDMAWFYQGRELWPQAYGAVCQALTLTQRPEHYLATEEAWGYKIHDLAALCAFKLGIQNMAEHHIRVAIKLAPEEEHLKRVAVHMGVNID